MTLGVGCHRSHQPYLLIFTSMNAAVEARGYFGRVGTAEKLSLHSSTMSTSHTRQDIYQRVSNRMFEQPLHSAPPWAQMKSRSMRHSPVRFSFLLVGANSHLVFASNSVRGNRHSCSTSLTLQYRLGGLLRGSEWKRMKYIWRALFIDWRKQNSK